MMESSTQYMVSDGDTFISIKPMKTEEQELEELKERAEWKKLKKEAKAILEAKKLESIENKNKNKLADGLIVYDAVTLFALYQLKFLDCGLSDDQVEISRHLEGKVVGLYFFSFLSGPFVFRELGYMYHTLKRRMGQKFELVFIPKFRDPYNDDHRVPCGFKLKYNRLLLFRKKFLNFFKGSKQPWLAVPFSEMEVIDQLHFWSASLRDTFEPAELVIIQPGENIAHAYAMDIFREFGIDAYPFSKSRLTEFIVESLQSRTLLESLSSCFGEPETTGPILVSDKKNGTKVPLRDLSGKKILLFLDPCRDELVYKKVSGWYKEMKQMDDEFEMVRGCYNKYKYKYVYEDEYEYMYEDEDEEEGRYENFPWLELSSYSRNGYREMSEIFKYTGMKVKMDKRIPMFLAFGRDGKFITMTSLENLIYDDDCQTSPDFFDNVRLYGQVAWTIAIEKRWRQLHEDCGEVHNGGLLI